MKYRMIHLSETDSTNEYAKRLARDGAEDRTVIIADSQSAGKGRLGRSFDSRKGKGVFMSILIRPHITLEQVSRLTLVAAVAVYEAIEKFCGLKTGIKWPNDIVVDGKKLCGILTEMSADSTGVKYVVVGIGVNVLNESFSEELSDLATSIYMCTGKKCSIEELIDVILECFEKYYVKYLSVGTLTVIRDIYDANLIHTNCTIKAINCNEVIQGVCKGIGNEGQLLIDTGEEIKEIISGEISVRGVYGYV